MNKGLDGFFSLTCYATATSPACWTVGPNFLVPFPVDTHRMWQLNALVGFLILHINERIHALVAYKLTECVPLIDALFLHLEWYFIPFRYCMHVGKECICPNKLVFQLFVLLKLRGHTLLSVICAL